VGLGVLIDLFADSVEVSSWPLRLRFRMPLTMAIRSFMESLAWSTLPEAVRATFLRPNESRISSSDMASVLASFLSMLSSSLLFGVASRHLMASLTLVIIGTYAGEKLNFEFSRQKLEV
jgi:hypothetical protein